MYRNCLHESTFIDIITPPIPFCNIAAFLSDDVVILSIMMTGRRMYWIWFKNGFGVLLCTKTLSFGQEARWSNHSSESCSPRDVLLQWSPGCKISDCSQRRLKWSLILPGFIYWDSPIGVIRSALVGRGLAEKNNPYTTPISSWFPKRRTLHITKVQGWNPHNITRSQWYYQTWRSLAVTIQRTCHCRGSLAG